MALPAVVGSTTLVQTEISQQLFDVLQLKVNNHEGMRVNLCDFCDLLTFPLLPLQALILLFLEKCLNDYLKQDVVTMLLPSLFVLCHYQVKICTII